SSASTKVMLALMLVTLTMAGDSSTAWQRCCLSPKFGSRRGSSAWRRLLWLLRLFIPIRDYIPARRTPVVTQALLVANIAVFAWQFLLTLAGAVWVVPGYGLVPVRLSADPAGEGFTLLTSMFMHGDWLHLGGNMLFLYVFGDNVEDALGRLRYLGFYLLCGIVASLGHYLVD